MECSSVLLVTSLLSLTIKRSLFVELRENNMACFIEQTDRVLFLGAHLDDVEFGCGALVSALAKDGIPFTIAVLSSANKNASGQIQLTRDREEAVRSVRALGATEEQLYIGKCYGQVFDQTPQQLREELLHLRNIFQPTVVFFPSVHDIHQDHAALAENAMRMFRNGSCYGYEIVRSTLQFSPECYIQISQDALDAKVRGILCYQSQYEQSAGYYFDETLIRSIAVFRGGQCGMPLAEAFECYRMVYYERMAE